MNEWQSFYVIVGSAGAALIGVQFVVITLVSSGRLRPSVETLHAFATPTVVPFTAALTLSAIMSVPWHTLAPVSVVLVAAAVCGIVYSALVLRLAAWQTDYAPGWSDWLWYGWLPGACYAAIAVAALFLGSGRSLPFYTIAASALGLLLVGIHNAWDSVTHIVTVIQPAKEKKAEHGHQA
jgi:hypothetical protein